MTKAHISARASHVLAVVTILVKGTSNPNLEPVALLTFRMVFFFDIKPPKLHDEGNEASAALSTPPNPNHLTAIAKEVHEDGARGISSFTSMENGSVAI